MDILSSGISTPVALALVALIGYFVGRRRARQRDAEESSRREMKRARQVVRELETISNFIRRSLATHHASIVRFKERVVELGTEAEQQSWLELSEEAERMLKPTMKLATQMAHAYDEIRQQTNMLMTFTEVRTDPLTGLSNRRALDEALETMFSMNQRYGQTFSLVIFDIDHFKDVNDEQGHLEGDQLLKRVALVLDQNARDTDMVVRFGGEEFVIIMPETDLRGAGVFCDRIRKVLGEELPVTISGGAAAAIDGDSPKALLSRADSALYSAKTGGRNCVYRHSGTHIERITPPAEEAEDQTLDDVNEQVEELSGEARAVLAGSANQVEAEAGT